MAKCQTKLRLSNMPSNHLDMLGHFSSRTDSGYSLCDGRYPSTGVAISLSTQHSTGEPRERL
jgi:hypothetical protein